MEAGVQGKLGMSGALCGHGWFSSAVETHKEPHSTITITPQLEQPSRAAVLSSDCCANPKTG